MTSNYVGNIKIQANMDQNYKISFHSRQIVIVQTYYKIINPVAVQKKKGELFTLSGNVLYCRHCREHYRFPPQSRTCSSIGPAGDTKRQLNQYVKGTSALTCLIQHHLQDWIQNPLQYPSVYEQINKILWAHMMGCYPQSVKFGLCRITN